MGVVSKEIISDAILKAVQNYPVDKVVLFGSYARGEAHPTSDIDLVLYSDENIGFGFFGILQTLKDLLHKDIELIHAIDMGPQIERVLRSEGVVLYERH